MNCDKIDYEVVGHDLQLVDVSLDPGETVIAEAGAMLYFEQGIEYDVRAGDGSPSDGVLGSLLKMGKRYISGSTLLLTHFINKDKQRRKVAFSANCPGNILLLDMSKDVDGQLYCQRDSFLCASYGTKIDAVLTKRLGAGLFGGEGFILQKLVGDGTACIHAGGAIIKKQLQGETLRVDAGCLVAFTDGIDYDIALAGNLKTMMFGSEGIFLATLSEHGTVYLQSLPLARMIAQVLHCLPTSRR